MPRPLRDQSEQNKLRIGETIDHGLILALEWFWEEGPRYETEQPMSRHIQITFDAHDPRALSSFWRDVLGYIHPGPPGVHLPEDGDPLAAWDDFLARVGVPEEQRNARSAIEDPDGHGPRLFFQQVP